jgi:glutathione reductase (NADPH)
MRASYGWDVADGAFDWTRFRTHLNTELDRLEGRLPPAAERLGRGHLRPARVLDDPHTVRLADGSTHTAKHILIATGGRPERPGMPNDHLGIVSDDIFNLEELPKVAPDRRRRLHRLRVRLHHERSRRGGDAVLPRRPDPARLRRGGAGTDLRDDGGKGRPAASRHQHRRHGAGLRRSRRPDRDGDRRGMGAPAGVSRARPAPGNGGPVWVKASNGQEGVFDKVLFATGRRPNTDGMGLEEAGVEVGRRGQVVVDEYSQTAVPSIYAIGDVTNRVNLTPVAIREGMAFVETVFNGNPTPVDHDLIPSAVFTQPEFGTVGLSEEEAREQEPVDIYCTSFRPMQSAFAGRPDRVLMKLVVAKESQKVLGCHIVAPQAGEMIQLAGIAVKMGATKQDFDRTVAVHPTMSEELVTMKTPVRTA